MAITVTRKSAPAGDFVHVYVGACCAFTDLFPAGTAPDDDAIIATWQAGGVLYQDSLDDFPNLPMDIDLVEFVAAGAVRVEFVDIANEGNEDDDDYQESEYVVRVVNANFSA